MLFESYLNSGAPDTLKDAKMHAGTSTVASESNADSNAAEFKNELENSLKNIYGKNQSTGEKSSSNQKDKSLDNAELSTDKVKGEESAAAHYGAVQSELVSSESQSKSEIQSNQSQAGTKTHPQSGSLYVKGDNMPQNGNVLPGRQIPLNPGEQSLKTAGTATEKVPAAMQDQNSSGIKFEGLPKEALVTEDKILSAKELKTVVNHIGKNDLDSKIHQNQAIKDSVATLNNKKSENAGQAFNPAQKSENLFQGKSGENLLQNKPAQPEHGKQFSAPKLVVPNPDKTTTLPNAPKQDQLTTGNPDAAARMALNLGKATAVMQQAKEQLPAGNNNLANASEEFKVGKQDAEFLKKEASKIVSEGDKMVAPELKLPREGVAKPFIQQMMRESVPPQLAASQDATTTTATRAPDFMLNETAVSATQQSSSQQAVNRPAELLLPVNMPVKQWNQKFAEHVSSLALKGATQAQIRLDPPELGPLSIRIQHNGGDTQIQFTVNNPIARELIDSSMTRLREMLEEQGFENVDVDINNFNESEQQTAANSLDDSELDESINESGKNPGLVQEQANKSSLIDLFV